MAAFANVVLNNDAAVAKTFNPVSIDGAVARWQDKSGGIPLGMPRITHTVRPPIPANRPGQNAKNAMYRVTFKVDVPVLEVTSPSTGSGIQPAPTVAYVLTSVHEFMIPARSTSTERKDLLAFAKNFLSNTFATTAIGDLEPVW